MNLLQLAQRLHRESGRSSTAPSAVSGASVEHQRLFDWINDAWQDIQSRAVVTDWQWMRRSLAATASTSLTSLTYTGADLGASDFGRWRRYAQSDGQDLEYTVRVYRPSDATNVMRLAWMDPESFRHRYQDVAQPAGQPMDWSIDEQERLLIGPVSDQVYRIKADYIRANTDLEADGDAPDMPETFHTLLVWKALQDVGEYAAGPEILSRARRHARRLGSLLNISQGRLLTLGDPLA